MLNRRGRGFGIELECSGLSPRDFASRLRRYPKCCITDSILVGRGLGICLGEVHKHGFYRIKTDNSIGVGFELTSPVYHSLTAANHDIKQILRMVKWAECSVNKMCGLHVHVDFNKRLLQSMKPSLAIKFWNTLKIPKEFTPGVKRRSYCQIPPRLNKYSCLNYNETQYPTIEFRLFNCCLNPRYIMRAVKLSLDTADKFEDFLAEHNIKLEDEVWDLNKID